MSSQIILENSQLGKITIEPDMVATFPEGLIGFEHLTRFAIVDFAEYAPFQWLLSIDDPEISFPIISPLLVVEKYEPSISRAETYNLGDFEDKDLLLYAIVTIRPEIGIVTANLKGPIIINRVTKMGQQIVLHEEEYSTNQVFISIEESKDG